MDVERGRQKERGEMREKGCQHVSERWLSTPYVAGVTGRVSNPENNYWLMVFIVMVPHHSLELISIGLHQ